jgi:hypothetical protein
MAIVVMEGAPAAKRRKKSKCAPAHATVEAVPAAPVAKQHAAADNKPKRKKKAWKRISRAVDEVAAQPDAPAALPPPPAGLAARLSAPSLAGSKKGKGALHDCKQPSMHVFLSAPDQYQLPSLQAAAACCNRCGSGCRAAVSAGSTRRSTQVTALLR